MRTCPMRLPLADRAAGEPNDLRTGVNWRTSPGRMIDRDASVDASGYVRGDVPAVDELSRDLLVSYRHAS